MNDDTLYPIHIVECIHRFETYTSDGRDTFMRSIRDQDAVLRNFEVMGEATKQILPATRTEWPAVPWRRIAGLRDVLIHNYQGVDIDRIWNVIANDLPSLRTQLDVILRGRGVDVGE